MAPSSRSKEKSGWSTRPPSGVSRWTSSGPPPAWCGPKTSLRSGPNSDVCSLTAHSPALLHVVGARGLRCRPGANATLPDPFAEVVRRSCGGRAVTGTTPVTSCITYRGPSAPSIPALHRPGGSGQGLQPGVVEGGVPATVAIGGTSDQRLRRAVLDDPAVLQDQHPVGDLDRGQPV